MTKKVVGIAAAIMLCAALVPVLNAQTSLLTENFEGSFPPSGWVTTVGDECPNQWYRNDYTDESNYTGGSGFCANNDDDYWGYQYVYQNSLESPEFDCTGYDEVWLAFNVCWQDYEGTEHAYVDLYGEWPNYQASWMEIWEVENTGYNQGRRDSIDLTPYLGFGTEGIKVRFRYNEDEPESGWAYWYQVDNVRVWGSSGGGPTGVDFQMAQIIRPKDEEEGGVAFNPTCKVYLTAPEQQGYAADPTWPADVRCRITDLSSLQVVYDKTLTDYPFPLGYTTVDDFAPFTPEGGKKYKVLFVVTDEEDANPDNNSLEKNFTTGAAEDVTPTEIIAPADDQLNKFAPSAKFLEKAGVDEAAVVLHYRIEDATYHAVVSEDSLTHDFTANEEYTAAFSEVAVLTDGSSYTVTFWATNAKGSDISHPELSKPFAYNGIEEKPEIKEFTLAVSGNVVTYTLAKSTSVSLKVYDAAGNLVSVLASGSMTSGSHTSTLAAGPGVYFIKLVTPEYTAVRKALVIK